MEAIELRLRLNFRRHLSNVELQELVDRFLQLIEADVEEGVLTDNNEVLDFVLDHDRIDDA